MDRRQQSAGRFQPDWLAGHRDLASGRHRSWGWLGYTIRVTVYGYVRDADKLTSLALIPGSPASKTHAERTFRRLLPMPSAACRAPVFGPWCGPDSEGGKEVPVIPA